MVLSQTTCTVCTCAHLCVHDRPVHASLTQTAESERDKTNTDNPTGLWEEGSAHTPVLEEIRRNKGDGSFPGSDHAWH